MRTVRILTLSAALAWAALASGTTIAAPPPQDARAWIAASNRHAQVLLDVLARVAPESAGQFGVTGLDEDVTNLSAAAGERGREATTAALATLQASRTTEPNPLVRQDLDILIRSAQTNLRAGRLSQERLLPYTDVAALVYGGLRSLLDAQVAPTRRAAAVVRLRKYAGLVSGYEPITQQAMRLTRERQSVADLLPPARAQVERDLANGPILIQGLERLFDEYKIDGWREPFATLKQQLSEYQQFVRQEILPKTRTDFRLPPDLYALSLEQVGVTMQPEPLVAVARQAFVDIQGEMQRLAPVVAKARGLKTADYRDVIRALKKEQLVGEAILPHYRKRLAEIEAIITREQLVTLPKREARIRIATDAEAAQSPAPNMRPPRLLGNTGEMGEFILPLNIPAAPGSKAATLPYDDFTFEAASWTLTAHEARPGHEMQFAEDHRGRRVDGAGPVRFQQRERRRMGAVRRVDDAALHVIRGSAHLAAVQTHARRARFSRSRAAPRTRDAGRSPPRAARGGRPFRRDDRAGSRTLHVPRARPGDLVLLRVYASCWSCAPRSSAPWARASAPATSTTSSSPRACCRRNCCAKPWSHSS